MYIGVYKIHFWGFNSLGVKENTKIMNRSSPSPNLGTLVPNISISV